MMISGLRPGRRGRQACLAWLLPAASGCLYLGGINRAPEVSVSIDETSSQLVKGGQVLLRAAASDQDGDPVRLTWRISGENLAGEAFGVDGRLVPRQGQPATPLVAGDELVLTLTERGSYVVEVEASDPQGATGRVRLSFEVPNQAPEIALTLRPVDAAQRGRPAHARYVVTVATTREDDDDLGCGSGATVDWELLSPGEGSLQLWRELPCQPGTPILDRLELRGKAVDEPMTLQVRGRVTDPFGAVGEAIGTWQLEPNRPPCVSRSDPDFGVAAKVVVLHDPAPEEGQVGRHFEATHVDDDVAETRYAWSTSETLAGPFSPLSTQPGRSFAMPPDYARPGERFHLRLQVADQQSAPATCAVDKPLCADHAALPDGCYRWVTWEVEFR